MTIDELLAYINSDDGLSKKLRKQATLKKQMSTGIKQGKNPTDYMVEFWPGYMMQSMAYESALIHARGKFPDYLFRVLSPLQDQEELNYLRATYQPVTKDVFLEFSNTAKKSIPNGNIEFDTREGDDEGNDLEKYIFNDINNFNSITAWAASMIDQKLVDANGIFSIWPYYQVDENGLIIGETNPQPYIYNVPQIVWRKDHEYIVKTNKTTKEGGIILRYFGPMFVAQFDQVGNLNDYIFDVSRYFEHEIGYTPAQEMKGIAVIDDGDVSFESIFNIGVPHLNLAIIDSVTLLAIKKKVGYPTRVVMREKCEHQTGSGAMCISGKIIERDGERSIESTCPNCRGTGYIGVFGPFSELAINASRQIGGEGPNITAANALSYVSPSTEIPKFLRLEVEHEINRALEVLHLKSEPRGSGDISATEKNRDKENTEAFIKPISDQIWDIIDYTIECIGIMKFGKDQYEDLKPMVRPAQSFDLLGPDDYIAEMAEAKKSGAPEVVVQNIVYRYMQAVHHDDTISMKVFQLIEKSDRLLTMSSEQTAIGLSRGIVAKWEAVLHQSSTYIVAKTIMDYEQTGASFWDLPEGEQIDRIQETAKSEVPPDLSTEVLPTPVEP